MTATNMHLAEPRLVKESEMFKDTQKGRVVKGLLYAVMCASTFWVAWDLCVYMDSVPAPAPVPEPPKIAVHAPPPPPNVYVPWWLNDFMDAGFWTITYIAYAIHVTTVIATPPVIASISLFKGVLMTGYTAGEIIAVYFFMFHWNEMKRTIGEDLTAAKTILYSFISRACIWFLKRTCNEALRVVKSEK